MSDVDDFVKYTVDFLNANAIISSSDGIIRSTVQKNTWGNYFRGMTGKNIPQDQFKKIVTGSFTLDELDHITVGGIAERAFNLRIAEAEEERFDAYWLGYKDDKVKHAMLGSAAPFMFTAEMTGCSFGYGSRTKSGDLLVGHANAATVGKDVENAAKIMKSVAAQTLARAAQQQKQAEMLAKNLQVDDLKLYEPRNYRPPATDQTMRDAIGDRGWKENAVTIVGVRKSNTWKFYAQRRVICWGQHWIIRDVTEI